MVAWAWGLLQGSSVWISGSHHTWGSRWDRDQALWLCSLDSQLYQAFTEQFYMDDFI